MAKVTLKDPAMDPVTADQLPVGAQFKTVGGKTANKVYMVLQHDCRDGMGGYIGTFTLCWSFDDSRLVRFNTTNKKRNVLPVEITAVTVTDFAGIPEIVTEDEEFTAEMVPAGSEPCSASGLRA